MSENIPTYNKFYTDVESALYKANNIDALIDLHNDLQYDYKLCGILNTSNSDDFLNIIFKKLNFYNPESVKARERRDIFQYNNTTENDNINIYNITTKIDKPTKYKSNNK